VKKSEKIVKILCVTAALPNENSNKWVPKWIKTDQFQT